MTTFNVTLTSVIVIFLLFDRNKTSVKTQSFRSKIHIHRMADLNTGALGTLRKQCTATWLWKHSESGDSYEG